jgi:hypothetical protein
MSHPLVDFDTPVPGEADTQPVDVRGHWPKMLNLGEEVENELSEWLYKEIWEAQTEKSDVIDDWKRWQQQYWAQPTTSVKNFPFKRRRTSLFPSLRSLLRQFMLES